MSNLLDITKEDIAALNDKDLRDLVGKLCEADYRANDLSCRGIKWGGHQNAPDGGLDVVVDSEVKRPENSFILQVPTGFQVKATKMTAASCVEEMCPQGKLRESIKELIKKDGAYIIVSSKDDCADTEYKARVKKMEECISQENGRENFKLDFYDQGRLATWTRSHPSLILWVREKVGRSLSGWQAYGNWARTPGGEREEYIVDGEPRLYEHSSSSTQPRSIVEGLAHIRTQSRQGNHIRLTGLFGMGKTRFVQALFDERIGEGALDKYYAYYTDMSASPDPHPCNLVDQIVSDRKRAILVIDNCTARLHKNLVKRCQGNNNSISIITIECDVWKNSLNETEVFKLGRASDDTTCQLVAQHHPKISLVDRHRIAKFAGGNEKMAIFVG